MPRVYWAAPFFDNAWLAYNAACADRLRQDGITVFLPQEQAFNEPNHSPSAQDVFDGDLSQLRTCNALVAAIDGETIDAGVAAEAGLAYAYSIPILGLYTDIRRNRIGSGRSYKNLFVVGMIYRGGMIVHTEHDLTIALRNLITTDGV